MNIYKEIRVVFSNFNNKLIRGANFGKKSKKFIKLQVSTIRFK